MLTTMVITVAPAAIAAATGALMLLCLVVISLIAGPETAAAEPAVR